MLPVSFLSDYGLTDGFVGVCHGVIRRICPAVQIIDISHDIPSQNLLTGAVVLRNSLPYMPVGVHLAVVDPGVGTQRHAVAIKTADGNTLVGPDNGLLWLAAERLGGVTEAVSLDNSPQRLQPVSSTFHGRDIFAPVTAHLANGAELVEVGEAINPNNLVRLELSRPHREGNALIAHATVIDRFGNVALDAEVKQLENLNLTLGDQVEIHSLGHSFPAQLATTFADVGDGELLLLQDSNGALAIAANHDSAARWLGLKPGAPVRIKPLS